MAYWPKIAIILHAEKGVGGEFLMFVDIPA